MLYTDGVIAGRVQLDFGLPKTRKQTMLKASRKRLYTMFIVDLTSSSAYAPPIASYPTAGRLPLLDLPHAALLFEGLVHIEGVEQQVRLVAHALPQALELGLLEVVLRMGRYSSWAHLSMMTRARSRGLRPRTRRGRPRSR